MVTLSEGTSCTVEGIHAEPGQIIAGRKPGRERDGEIIIFDSTGTALHDVAPAISHKDRQVAGMLESLFPFSLY